jgi:hypothetical protein
VERGGWKRAIFDKFCWRCICELTISGSDVVLHQPRSRMRLSALLALEVQCGGCESRGAVSRVHGYCRRDGAAGRLIGPKPPEETLEKSLAVT